MEQYKGICFAKKRMTSASCLLLGKVQNVQGSDTTKTLHVPQFEPKALNNCQ
jgi:hypothetical protein